MDTLDILEISNHNTYGTDLPGLKIEPCNCARCIRWRIEQAERDRAKSKE